MVCLILCMYTNPVNISSCNLIFEKLLELGQKDVTLRTALLKITQFICMCINSSSA